MHIGSLQFLPFLERLQPFSEVPQPQPHAYKVISYPILDNSLRIAFNDNSAAEGRIEIFYDNAWGAVCDDGFRINEAQTACQQLGYDNAVGYNLELTTTTTFFLDNVECYPNHARLQDCFHSPWKVHNCNSYEGSGVTCSGGRKYF